MPNCGRYPAVPEPDLASLRKKVSPVLEEAVRHLERASAFDRNQTGVAHFLQDVSMMQLYLEDPDLATSKLREEQEALFNNYRKQRESGTAREPGRGSSETITFQLSPEAIAEDMARPFPPNPWRIPHR